MANSNQAQHSNIKEFLRWVEDQSGDIHYMIMGAAPDENQPLNRQGEEPLPIEDKQSSEEEAKQEEIPILPLRGIVVYPQTIVPLTIGQPRSIRLIDDVATGEKRIGLITAKNPDVENPSPEDLYQIGTIAVIHRLLRTPEGIIRLLVQGVERFKVISYSQTEPYLKATIEHHPEIIEDTVEVAALARTARDQFVYIASLIPSIPRELVESISAINDSLQTVYTIANFQRMELHEAQEILEIDSLQEKLKKLNTILVREKDFVELGQKIQNEARSEIEKVQREYFLREQLKAIQKELDEGAAEITPEIEEYKKRIEEAGLPVEAKKQAETELNRLSRLPSASPEYGVIRSYLDWLVSLPWSKTTQDNLSISHAREVLEQDHYGLKDVKERILEFLAVRKLRLDRKGDFTSTPAEDLIRREREGVILCFVGPPGVGKTSLGRSIARAMDRKFIRISLGGVRDEAEIRGHRRTYIGAMPGRIIQALRRVESNNPVFMLDEIDKLGIDFRGDPSSALLEVLDPEQNSEFRDNYIEVAYDLSQVMFITTANQLETIPLPLLDRMEVIKIAGYTESEKIAIAVQYLVPRQLRENGLLPGEIHFSRNAIQTIVRYYTREAGVRNLEREIGTICRKVATLITENKTQRKIITPQMVRKYLGRPQYYGNEEIARRTIVPGVATGLAWTPVGGDVLFIEATSMPGSKGYQITGSIGNVMQESAKAALSYVRSKAKELGIDENFFDKCDIHLHIPAGAQPKDGPSAGITMATALVSLLTNRNVRPDVGMTGEITLQGQVLPVGGIKEKLLAAHRAGLKTILIPALNEPDLEDLPKEVLRDLHIVLVKSLDEVLKIALESKKSSKKSKSKGNKNGDDHVG